MEADARRASLGCGLLVLYNNVFRRRNASSSPQHQQPANSPTHPNSKRQRPASDTTPSDLSVAYSKAQATAPHHQQMPAGRPPPCSTKALACPARMQSFGLSVELDSMINDHQRNKGSSAFVRASSGNVMLYGNLGNLRAPGAVTPPSSSALDHPARITQKEADGGNPYRPSRLTGNSAASCTAMAPGAEVASPKVLCRALSRRMDPEELKEMGNEEYKKGRYAEAVVLYDRAILIDPDKASYWSNKAAALIGMGLLLEAVGECKEAVRIDPSYGRAHQRLGTLHLRLGVAEKAIHHYKLAGNEASSSDVSRAQALHTHLSKCIEARKLRDWQTLLKEAQSAVSAGADSAPQVFASQAEALLALQRHDDADATLRDAPPILDRDASAKFFGASSNAYMLAVQAQVDMAAGRFEDAVAVSQRAARLDPSSREVSAVARKARVVASARSRGNDLFKASKFKEACLAYGEGLDHDPSNAILFSNRAACRSKLGQWDKAIEDCNAALNMRPSYNKARLRRADCNAKLEQWEASIQDYEALLLGAMPGDEEISKALVEAQFQLKKLQRGDGIKDMKKRGENLIHITTIDQFRQYTTSPGLSVALLFNQSSEVSRGTIDLMEEFCKEYPTVNFLKVDLDENPYLEEEYEYEYYERRSSVPLFQLYKNGSNIKDIDGSDRYQLQNSLKSFEQLKEDTHTQWKAKAKAKAKIEENVWLIKDHFKVINQLHWLFKKKVSLVADPKLGYPERGHAAAIWQLNTNCHHRACHVCIRHQLCFARPPSGSKY